MKNEKYETNEYLDELEGQQDELTEDDLELDEEDELTEDDLEQNRKDESIHSPSRGRRRMSQIGNNVGLVIPQNEKEELDRTLEEILNQQSTAISAGRGYAAPLKIVVADTSVRLELSRELTKMLNNPSSLYIGTNSTGLVITNADNLSVQSVRCSSRSGKAIVYNSRLIKTIASQFDLDFSKCTSLSFHREYIMIFDLRSNGLDSMKACYEKIQKIDELEFGVDHNIKDALMYLIHANEVLFKLVLKKHHEYLTFNDINSYMLAKQKLMKDESSEKTVMDFSPNLKTVSLMDSIKRLQFLCDVEVSEDFIILLQDINKERNTLMHFEINLNEKQVESLIGKIKLCYSLAMEFFSSHIEGIKDYLHSKRFELSVEDYREVMEDMLREQEIALAMQEERDKEIFEMEARQYGYFHKRDNGWYYD